MNQLFDKKYPVTSSLLLLTTGVFLSMLLLRGFDYESVQTVYEFGGVLGDEIQVDPSKSWRLLAAMFVHVGLQHFVLNMVTLYFIGRIAEDLFGSKAFLALYLLSGLMGNLFVLVFSPEVVAAGASTALSGLFATIVSLPIKQMCIRDRSSTIMAMKCGSGETSQNKSTKSITNIPTNATLRMSC